MAGSRPGAPTGGFVDQGEQGELLQVTQQVFRSGPLPDPDELAAYQAIDPTLVDRIVGMAEVSVHGRHEVLSTGMRAEAFASRLSAITTAVVAVGGLGASVVLIVQGYEVTALLTAVPSILLGIGHGVGAIRSRADDK